MSAAFRSALHPKRSSGADTERRSEWSHGSCKKSNVLTSRISSQSGAAGGKEVSPVTCEIVLCPGEDASTKKRQRPAREIAKMAPWNGISICLIVGKFWESLGAFGNLREPLARFLKHGRWHQMQGCEGAHGWINARRHIKTQNTRLTSYTCRTSWDPP